MSSAIPQLECFVHLPVTQLRLAVRIWNSEPASSSNHASSAAPDPQSLNNNAALSPVPQSCASSRPLPVPRPHDTHLVLLHGWLDNLASWDPICPFLIANYTSSSLAAAKNAQKPKDATPSKLVCYAIEFSGHGDSSHRSPSGTYHPAEHAVDVLQAISILGIPSKFFVMGHSMGAAVGYILASALKNHLLGLTMMDSMGPWVSPVWMNHPRVADSSILKLATALQEHLVSNKKRLPKVYPNKEAIVERYVSTNPFMDDSSAKLLAERAVKPVYYSLATQEQVDVSLVVQSKRQADYENGEWKKGWVFKHDNRLVSNALVTPLEDNTIRSFAEVTCPVLVFLATNVKRKEWYATKGRDPKNASHWILPESNPAHRPTIEKRMAAFPKGCEFHMIEGDHHIHMDKCCEGMAKQVMEWMQRAYVTQIDQPIQPMPEVIDPAFFKLPVAQSKL